MIQTETIPRADALIARFKAIPHGLPKWAWQFKPSVPFVGERYRPGKGLLIYASAENLSWLNAAPTPVRFCTEDAWNRYRVQYESSGRNSTSFFPDVGIQPVTDGGLFAAGLFIADKCGLQKRVYPRSFLETIAVSNWCKFSIMAKTNRDYLADIKKLTASLPFVIGELVLLEPKIVLIPKPLWKHPILRAAMIGASPHSTFLPVAQFNARVINCHLREYDRSAARLKKQLGATPLARWMARLCRANHSNAWRYIAAMDKAMRPRSI